MPLGVGKLEALPSPLAVASRTTLRSVRLRRLLALVLAAAWAYDYLRNVRRVRLIFGRGRSRARPSPAEASAQARLASIVARCPALSSVYWPTWYAPGALAQFVLVGLKEFRARVFQRSPYIREVCRLRDGGQVALDWVLPDPACADQKLPVCVLLHGAFQDSTSVTMSDLALDLAERGLPAVVMNRRGYGGIDPGDAELRLSMFGFDEDLDDVLQLVAQRQPGRPIAIVGFSCGSGFAGRYAGSRGLWSAWSRLGGEQASQEGPDAGGGSAGRARPRLLCSVAYDPGYDVSPDGAISRIKPPFSWFVNFSMKYFYAFRHRGEFIKKSESWASLVGAMLSPTTGVVETFRKCRKLSGVDGSSAWLDMQEVRLQEIALPSLLINSRDDPICVWQNVEAVLGDIKANPNLVLADLQRGCKFTLWGTSNFAHRMIAELVISASEEWRAGSS